MCWSLYFLAWILLCFKGAGCLRMVALQIPSRAVVGDTIRLSCRFELEGDTLYSIKWYREDVEFFRFVPRDRPPGQYFYMNGVRVDQINSENNFVIVEDIDLNTTGTYKCEVSADAPSFQTESAKKKLTVIEKQTVEDPDIASESTTAPLLVTCTPESCPPSVSSSRPSSGDTLPPSDRLTL